MRRECRERFPRHRLQRKPIDSDPGMHHGTCVTHVPWCMSVLLTRDGEENDSGYTAEIIWGSIYAYDKFMDSNWPLLDIVSLWDQT